LPLVGDLISRLRDCERRVVVGWICHFEGLVSIVDSPIAIRIESSGRITDSPRARHLILISVRPKFSAWFV
jgi:hypothetical protein